MTSHQLHNRLVHGDGDGDARVHPIAVLLSYSSMVTVLPYADTHPTVKRCDVQYSTVRGTIRYSIVDRRHGGGNPD